MANKLRNLLSVVSILTPVVYLGLAVINFDTPMTRFKCWVGSTLVSELLFYTYYILGMRDD